MIFNGTHLLKNAWFSKSFHHCAQKHFTVFLQLSCRIIGSSQNYLVKRPRVISEEKLSRNSKLMYHTGLPLRNAPKESKKSDVVKSTKPVQGEVTLGTKVKERTKDAYYTSIIIVGVGVTAIMFYTIFKELFFKNSPNRVYSEALAICKKDSRVVDTVGVPIKGYGEMSSRGRRRHVSFMEYMQDDVKMMRVKFYIEGSFRKGTVHLEVKENERGKYEYRYLFVELDGYPHQTIIIEDNR